MKKKNIEKLAPAPTKKNGFVVTVQTLDDVLILNVYRNKKLEGRHCINTETYEFAQWVADKNVWNGCKFDALLGLEPPYWYYSYNRKNEFTVNSKEENELAISLLSKNCPYAYGELTNIVKQCENMYVNDKRERTEARRIGRVKDTMGLIPELPADIKDWIFQTAAGGVDYAIFDKEKKKYSCTSCGIKLTELAWKKSDGEKKIRHNDDVICPACKKVIKAKKRAFKGEISTHMMVLQPVNESFSVARHFDVGIYYEERKHKVVLSEAMRITLNKLAMNPKYACDIYYNQESRPWTYDEIDPWFDNKGNPKNRKASVEYLYPGEIREALEDTEYEDWSLVFSQLAAGGKKLAYNELMATKHCRELIRTIEYLFKGRFNRLLEETSKNISLWSCTYCGPLFIEEESIEEVFFITDRQKINRIRDVDGGENILRWMRWSDSTNTKIPEDTLTWLAQNNIESKNVKFIVDRLSLQKIANYVKRQQEEGYKGKSARTILDQWEDYLDMCKKLKKNLSDEMVYKPRELKRRHDEAVAEIRAREAELVADEYSQRFPGAEDVLREIKEKFEYQNEQYMIVVPERLVEIVAEGRALHHCAGGSDRYFDRIAQRETYICFLRKTTEPKVPYYTIEVEPGGTIRQHRGMYDEEPEIEKVKPFLREWQQALKRKLSKKDMEYAAVSAVKREENIEELRAKNNTRVLEGLMEDFMEAV